MILDNGLISTLFVSMVIHALLLCIVFFRHTKSQLSDYEGIPINIANCGKSSISLGEFVNIPLVPEPPKQLRGLFACYFRGVPALRILALGPVFFYGITILCYALYAGKAKLSAGFDIGIAGHVLLGLGVVFHVTYFVVKAVTQITVHLEKHHPSYRDKQVSSVSLWTDFYPTVLGYKK